ncbi:MAG TPA: hypothetical protein EYQ26_09530 [Rhodospirillales bacterium]|nr:hypothetical protein [Rhodospirillales bacterium]
MPLTPPQCFPCLGRYHIPATPLIDGFLEYVLLLEQPFSSILTTKHIEVISFKLDVGTTMAVPLGVRVPPSI